MFFKNKYQELKIKSKTKIAEMQYSIEFQTAIASNKKQLKIRFSMTVNQRVLGSSPEGGAQYQ